jgi:hypothetical protein
MVLPILDFRILASRVRVRGRRLAGVRAWVGVGVRMGVGVRA